jgi:hypothetical protein
MRSPRCAAIGVAAVLLGSSAYAGQDTAELSERARDAERVVVGRVAAVNPVWRNNDHGDRLIISVVRVTVDETLKGQAQQQVDVEVEGGTIDGLTLRVSDMQAFLPGDRAVFYLARSQRGTFVPHERGRGLLKIDREGRVAGSATTLEQVRRSVVAGGRGPAPRPPR